MRTTRLIPNRHPMHRRTGHRAPWATSTQSVSSSTSSSNRALPHMQTKMECIVLICCRNNKLKAKRRPNAKSTTTRSGID
eukprot:scaffold422403_cov75-Attheya_sp.AAC.1